MDMMLSTINLFYFYNSFNKLNKDLYGGHVAEIWYVYFTEIVDKVSALGHITPPCQWLISSNSILAQVSLICLPDPNEKVFLFYTKIILNKYINVIKM